MWKIDSTLAFREWLRSLDARSQAHVAKSVDKLSIFGPTLGRPDVDGVNDSRHPNMKELRIRHAGRQYRVLFAFDPRRHGVLLIGGDKVGEHQKRFYNRLIDQADRLYTEHLKRLADTG